MDAVYLACWTGGYEAPSYQAHTTEEAAMKTARGWAEDMDDESDTIDVLRIDLKNMTVTRIEAPVE